MTNIVPGVPSANNNRTATWRQVVLADPVFLAGKSLIIRGALSRDPLNTNDLDVLRAGMVMGKITSGGKYAPAIIGALATAHNSSGTTRTSLTVPAAVAVEIVRRLGSAATLNIIGPPTANGTIATETVTYSAVNVSTGVITVTDLSNDYVVGSLIQPVDGSQIPLFIIGNGYGLKVTDRDDIDIDVDWAEPVAGGEIDASQILNYGSDTTVQTWIKAKLNASGDTTEAGHAPFRFDDEA